MHQGLLHCQTSYLASPGSGSHSVPVVTAGTWVPVLGDTVSEISKKFLIPGNNPLVLLGISVCVCVMSAPEDGRCSHYETLVPNPPSFCWYSGRTKAMVCPPVQRTAGGRRSTCITSWHYCCVDAGWLETKTYKNWLLRVELVLLGSIRCEYSYGLEKCKNNFWQQLFFRDAEINCKNLNFRSDIIKNGDENFIFSISFVSPNIFIWSSKMKWQLLKLYAFLFRVQEGNHFLT